MKEKLITSAEKDNKWLKEAKYRQENESWLEISFAIALKILRYLRHNNITQKSLAEKMDCSPQYLNKVLKGNENLSLETICKIQNVTGLVLIEVPLSAKEKDSSDTGQDNLSSAA